MPRLSHVEHIADLHHGLAETNANQANAFSPNISACGHLGPSDHWTLLPCPFETHITVSTFCLAAGPEAEQLLMQLGYNSAHTTLASVCSQCHHFQTPSGHLDILSTHLQLVGNSMVTSLLVQQTEPANCLTAQVVSYAPNALLCTM